MGIEYRTSIRSWDVTNIIVSSIALGLGCGVAITALTICVSAGDLQTAFSDLPRSLLTLLRAFLSFAAAGFGYGIAYQYAGPVINKLPGRHLYETDRKIAAIPGLLVAVAVAFGTFSVWGSLDETPKAPYTAHLSEYLAEPTGSDAKWDGKLTGKVMTVNVATQSIDDLYQKLNADYQPTRPEEVGTVVWLKWGTRLDAKLSNGGSSYYRTCDVTIIDLAMKIILVEISFAGDRPTVPGHGAPGTNFYGSTPVAEIVTYIQSRPQR